MTYQDFIFALTGMKASNPRIKLQDGTILTIEQWRDNLIVLLGKDWHTVKMVNCEVTIVFG